MTISDTTYTETWTTIKFGKKSFQFTMAKQFNNKKIFKCATESMLYKSLSLMTL